jgi:hypothetical protein
MPCQMSMTDDRPQCLGVCTCLSLQGLWESMHVYVTLHSIPMPHVHSVRGLGWAAPGSVDKGKTVDTFCPSNVAVCAFGCRWW